MARVFRLARRKYARPTDLLSGAGASLYGGRWNQKGTRLVYAASHQSLAVLEALVHASTLPTDLVLVEIEVPDALATERWSVANMPRGWDRHPPPRATQRRGTVWARAARSLAVWVPSAVVAAEWNCLINPAHPSIGRARARVVGPFQLDARLRP